MRIVGLKYYKITHTINRTNGDLLNWCYSNGDLLNWCYSNGDLLNWCYSNGDLLN
jgi:hypothetical protein